MANLREEIASAMKNALKAKDQAALATMRLISAALKDRNIAARGNGNQDGIGDDEILSMMQTMIKQRTDSAKMYRDGNRPELAEAEEAEITIITGFLPAQLGEAEIEAAIADAVAATGASRLLAALRAAGGHRQTQNPGVRSDAERHTCWHKA